MASIGEFIRQRQPEIVARWTNEVRSAASARHVPPPTLTTIMPALIRSLSEDADSDSVAAERHSYVLAHLATRIREGFDLADVLAEFEALERCIVRMWADVPEQLKPPESDIVRVRERIQHATFELTDEFIHHMLQEEQSEKRYMRLLQEIATEALRDERSLLSDRLRDVVDVIVEAMDAGSAAVVIFDGRGDHEPAVACNGDEALASYTRLLASEAYSTEPRPEASDEARAQIVAVPGSLRQRGVRSLLAASLPRQSGLRGMLCVAFSDGRGVALRDLHRLELFADRLALHLENARLFVELRDTIASLHVERVMRERFVATLAHDLRGPLEAARLAADRPSAGCDAVSAWQVDLVGTRRTYDALYLGVATVSTGSRRAVRNRPGGPRSR